MLGVLIRKERKEGKKKRRKTQSKKDTRKLLKVIDTFMTWIIVTVTQVYTYVQTHQITHINYMHFVLEKAMAPHSGTLAWKISWMEEPGGLQSMGPRRVGHNWVTSLSLFTFMHWRRKWQPTPVFLPGDSQGQGSLVGCRLWGCTESDTTEVT